MQSETFSVLDRNCVSMYDLLIFTLRTHLPPVHSSHCQLLQHHTSDVPDLWSEQFLSDTRTWAQVSREMYWVEVITLIHPHASFHFWGTHACLEQLKNFSMVDMGKKYQLLGVLLDADLTWHAAPKVKKTCQRGCWDEIGTEGAQQEEWAENWADLDVSDAEWSHCEIKKQEVPSRIRPNETCLWERHVDHKQRFQCVQHHMPNNCKPP